MTLPARRKNVKYVKVPKPRHVWAQLQTRKPMVMYLTMSTVAPSTTNRTKKGAGEVNKRAPTANYLRLRWMHKTYLPGRNMGEQGTHPERTKVHPSGTTTIAISSTRPHQPCPCYPSSQDRFYPVRLHALIVQGPTRHTAVHAKQRTRKPTSCTAYFTVPAPSSWPPPRTTPGRNRRGGLSRGHELRPMPKMIPRQ